MCRHLGLRSIELADVDLFSFLSAALLVKSMAGEELVKLIPVSRR